MTTTIIKAIIPKEGIAKTPLELLQRSRDLLADEAHWVQGAMFCPTKIAENHGGLDLDEDFDVHAERERIADQIMRDGLCGDGWGVCAVGAVSLIAGLNAVIERPDDRWDNAANAYVPITVKNVESLVDEEGREREDRPAPKARVDRYRAAVTVLNEVTNELAERPDWMVDPVKVWGVNDSEATHLPAEWKGNTHGFVLHIFDQAIERLAAK